jgi:hypothetical protein
LCLEVTKRLLTELGELNYMPWPRRP